MSDLWAIVLAGGGGKRLSDVSRRMYGYERPKQFCDFDGNGTLLQRTVQRVSLAVPQHRISVVTTRPWGGHARHSLATRPGIVHLEQPSNKDTGPGLLLPVLEIERRDPDALVAVMPSDHHVADPDRFMRAVRTAAAAVRRDPGRVVLLGVRPDRVEEGYGWILARGQVGITAVAAFREKPTPREAERLVGQGALINTMVMVGAVRTMSALFARHTPRWHAALRPCTAEAVEEAYAALPPSNVSHEVLSRATDQLDVLPVEGVGWTDVGTPDRLWRALTPMAEAPAVEAPAEAAAG